MTGGDPEQEVVGADEEHEQEMVLYKDVPMKSCHDDHDDEDGPDGC